MSVEECLFAAIAKQTAICPQFIPTGSIGKQRGEIDWIVVLGFVVVFEFWQLLILQKTANTWAKSYQLLESESQKPISEESSEFEALGQSWKSPRPRIDYGANNQRKKDAEALCIIGREMLLEMDFKSLRCE